MAQGSTNRAGTSSWPPTTGSDRLFLACLAMSALAHGLLLLAVNGVRVRMPSAEPAVAAGGPIHIRLVSVSVPSDLREDEAIRLVRPLAEPEPDVLAPDEREDPDDAGGGADDRTLEVLSEVSGREDAYWDAVREAVAAELRYPRAAQQRRAEDTVILRIVIGAAGQLLKAEPVPPYGEWVLTRAALAAVRRASPFPSPAACGLPGQCLVAQLPVRFVATRN